jgi:hypothetical protein
MDVIGHVAPQWLGSVTGVVAVFALELSQVAVRQRVILKGALPAESCTANKEITTCIRQAQTAAQEGEVGGGGGWEDSDMFEWHENNYRTEAVAQSVAALTTDQKAWGINPQSGQSKVRLFIRLFWWFTVVWSLTPFSRDRYPCLPNHKWWVQLLNPNYLSNNNSNTESKCVRSSLTQCSVF